MNTLLKFTFRKPVKIDFGSDLTYEETTLLEVSDSPKSQSLSVQLSFQDYPSIVKTVVLYSGEEYSSLVNWTYQNLVDRIRTYYTNGMGYPNPDYVEAPEAEQPPEPEASEPAAEEPPVEPPAEEPVVTTTKTSSKA